MKAPTEVSNVIALRKRFTHREKAALHKKKAERQRRNARQTNARRGDDGEREIDRSREEKAFGVAMAGRAHADAGSEGLPQANVKRVVKEKLAELAHAHFDDDRKDVLVNKDALLAFSESAKIFIHFLSATYVRNYPLSLNLPPSLCLSLSLCFSLPLLLFCLLPSFVSPLEFCFGVCLPTHVFLCF
jgi:DNA polymerase epsilon subunit 3